jgi:squalene-associated FAD-dependent desaturase
LARPLSASPAPGERRLCVAVVGGGWAGLAAAVDAVEAGADVTLFEMAAQLGGRARTVELGGRAVDNGQHILIGAYVDTLELMRRVGVDVESAVQRSALRLVDTQGHGLVLPGGPAWLAFARGVWRLRHWPATERLRFLGAAASWAASGFRCDERLTVDELVAAAGQRARRELIDPLCVAALNTPARQASAAVFLRVMKDALFSAPGSADLLLPRRLLGSMLPQPAGDWLAAHGATVATGQRVTALERDGTAWRVTPGSQRAFDAVVLACSATEAARLAQPHAADWAAAAQALRYEPIATVYVERPGVALPFPMTTLDSNDVDAPAQFAFDLGTLRGEPGRFALVVSGAAEWLARGAAPLESACAAQFDALVRRPAQEAAAHADVGPRPEGSSRMLVEKRATFACTPGLRRPPAQVTAGLWAAGDYVEGPYPATLEGAVRSGRAATRRLLGR